jgi:hypothetical protein
MIRITATCDGPHQSNAAIRRNQVEFVALHDACLQNEHSVGS